MGKKCRLLKIKKKSGGQRKSVLANKLIPTIYVSRDLLTIKNQILEGHIDKMSVILFEAMHAAHQFVGPKISSNSFDAYNTEVAQYVFFNSPSE